MLFIMSHNYHMSFYKVFFFIKQHKSNERQKEGENGTKNIKEVHDSLFFPTQKHE